MKIRSLLLGSVAAAGLSTGAFAADLGVETSLDVCDALGLSGLTISSDTNCLVITGEVVYEFSWGEYAPGAPIAYNWTTGDTVDVITPNLTWESSVTGFLQFTATADSDFGPASATIKLGLNDTDINVNEMWVGIGDTTMIMAGLKGSIFEDGDDEPLNFLGLFNSEMVDAGVYADYNEDVELGGHVLQIVHDMGNGLSIGAGLEDLANDGTFVGVIQYASDTLSAHASFAVDEFVSGDMDDWLLHTGFTGTFDTVKVVGAFSAWQDPGGYTYWNALGSASVTFDTITIAGSLEADGDNAGNSQWGAGASIVAAIDDGITVSGGIRHWEDDLGDTTTQAAVGVTADVSEGIAVTAEAGYIATTNPIGDVFYGKGELTWEPGGGFTATGSAEANSLGAFKLGTSLTKTIE